MAEIRQILLDIESELKALKLWQEEEIDPQLLRSAEPFCCDTLNFEQWLQFILIPKMHALLTQQQPLPKKALIAPMAEHVWQNQLDKKLLIELLRSFDASLSEV
tara:strand:- start:4180 stop:4491 length:312 start_codon:yes stop_codon:yes gene_type:complete